ncbi:MAG: uracil-DNA glycosylase [Planctomycetes bacterium]|nr:uracil-DNA glycosylase [Planctomycetota bacterium]
MEPPQIHPRQELADLARAVSGLTELDRLLGVTCSPLPRAQASAPIPEAPQSFVPARAKPPQPRPQPQPQPAIVARATPDLALPTRRVENEGRLHALAKSMAGCQKCQLAKGRTKLVFGQGDAAAELVFVGEGPGYHEDMQGMAFVGPSGALLTKMINAMGYLREEVFICNVVKCRPPRNRDPQPDEIGTCLPFLRQQLEIIRPKVICALGKSAAIGLGLIGPDESLGRNRGRLLSWGETPAVLTYHPAYLLRKPDEKRKAWTDLKLLFPHLERRRPSPIKPDETERVRGSQ